MLVREVLFFLFKFEKHRSLIYINTANIAKILGDWASVHSTRIELFRLFRRSRSRGSYRQDGILHFAVFGGGTKTESYSWIGVV